MEGKTLLGLIIILVATACSTSRQGQNYTINYSRVQNHKEQNVAERNETRKQDSWMIQEDEIGKKKADKLILKASAPKKAIEKSSPVEKNTAIASSEYRVRNHLVSSATTHLGVPYRYGGNGPGVFDCSGFTKYCMRDIGIELARNSGQQAKQGRKIKIKDAQKGDLVFFGKGNHIDHVGIVTEKKGNSLYVIHASTSRGVIIEDVLASRYWKQRIKYAVDIVSTVESEFAMSRK